MPRDALSRRGFVTGWFALPFLSALSLSVNRLAAQNASLPLTPQCGSPEDLTRAQTAGPFFTPDTPLKRAFRGDGHGEPVTLIGFVLNPDCRPLADAAVELWHADSSGRYDNRGHLFRGHQRSDDAGRFVFETILPGRYPGRTRHFHVMIRPQGGKPLTTQLYFPGERGNRRDSIFHESLLMEMNPAADGKIARFDFVVDA